jgi:iron complex transport system substrate-binding protein
MTDDSRGRAGPTRRDTIKYGGVVIGGGLLAGCTGQSGPGSGETEDPTETNLPTETSTDEAATAAETDTETSTPEDESYSVTIPPIGTVEFDSVPESYCSMRAFHGEMGIALGQADKFQAVASPDQLPHWMYNELGIETPGADELEAIPSLENYSFDEEWFYEADLDVHLMDPVGAAWAFESVDWERVAENVGPFVGHYSRTIKGTTRDYPYLGLYETFGKVAEVFQERERFEALKSLHDEFIDRIQSELPPQSERPEIALTTFYEGSFYPYHIDEGTGKKQYSDLGVTNAMEDVVPDDATFAEVDFETMLEVDPDIIVIHNAILFHDSREAFEEQLVAKLRDDPVGGELSVVKNNQVYMGGNNSQGPITNLFQTEAAAKQLFPDRFGEFPGWGEVSGDQQLFDRQHVADIINGEI